ncbi:MULTISPECIES: hypothetical protein [unclassified Nonomuraea]|uniref:hypothetical protein n=1 Tax=unclassified Nonomuraea TaxID=2593643 RepID=UPI0033C31619
MRTKGRCCSSRGGAAGELDAPRVLGGGAGAGLRLNVPADRLAPLTELYERETGRT